ncbi:MAG: DUF2851 family protein [Terrimicrobiaceae bacterium]
MTASREFPYEQLRSALGAIRLGESSPSRIPELELQARIFSGEFGVSWRGENGETVEIVHFGIWNREPGPDFCGARVLVDGVEMTGDIEIDQDVRDWENHGHSRNPSYENVVLHGFVQRGQRRYFTRTPGNRAVTQVCLAARKPSKPLEPGRAGTIDETRAEKLIEAAAGFRLHRKCDNFQRAARLRGRDEALFEAIAAAMGFKNNKIPFLLVAQRTGLARARAADGEALLFGLSGFLKAGHFDQGDDEARAYLRGLWEKWWAIRDRERRLILPDDAWRYSALRPANHPHRRMGALAVAVRSFAVISRAVESGNDADFATAFSSLHHAFWQRHASLAADTLPKVTALVGGDRALDLLINVFLPARPYDDAWPLLCSLPGPTPSRKVLRASEWLVGIAPPASFRSAMRQQGLLQLAEDFRHMSSEEVWQSFARGWTPREIVRHVES